VRRRFSRAARLLRREKWRDQEEQRRHDQRDERELPLEQEQRRAEEEDPQERGKAVAEAGEHERLDRRHVGREALEHVAEAALVQRVRREALHVSEHARAQAQEEPLSDPRGEVVVGEGDDSGQQRQAT